ncbi:hypothetical protein SEA_NICEHOUSE_240 [Rhodococcus phage NiceHouse]|nr:hypothetical protein SEA_NICEHOUSE_240 [Rhodococcus phage NiceHouse]
MMDESEAETLSIMIELDQLPTSKEIEIVRTD